MRGAPPCVGLFGLVFILFILFGLFAAVKPELAWQIQEGWKFRNAEPSDLSLVVTRVGGIFAVIIGFLFLVGVL